jgi:uncharacterized protein (DUF111 family)
MIKRLAERYLVIRLPSGLSGDMCVTGLAALAGLNSHDLNTLIAQIHLPALDNSVVLADHSVQNIAGYQLQVQLPREHSHRSWADIKLIISNSEMSDRAKGWALDAFHLLAMAEAKVHNSKVDDVRFHEVGALDSILDICLAGQILDAIAPDKIICGALPICDGQIRCEHGLLASPAPAVQELLVDVPVYGIAAQGETVTPTALALLKAWQVEFGNWPQITIRKIVRSYGQKIIPDVPNGALFTLGELHDVQSDQNFALPD